MKTITKIILIILTFLIMSNRSFAKESFIALGEKIPNVSLHLKTPFVERDKDMYRIIKTDTNELVYCIEPGVMLYDGNYTERNFDIESDNLTWEQWDYLTKLAYYGYGYQGRNDIKWYVVTQYLIWDYLLKDTGDVYFLNDQRERQNLYQEEIQDILEDIEKHDTFPSFLTHDDYQVDYEVKYNEELVLEDTNHVLSDFLIENYSQVDYEVKDDTITLRFEQLKNNILFFQRNVGDMERAKIYYQSDSQKVMSRGSINPHTRSLNVMVQSPILTIKKTSTDKANLSFLDGEYGIFYENGVPYGTITLDEAGTGSFTDMWPGKYYIQEIKAPYGYQLNEEKIFLEIKKEDVVIEVQDSPIKKKVIIEKYLVNKEGSIALEPDAEFEIYNSKKELVQTFSMNAYGKCELDLFYDTYKIVQTKGRNGYRFVEPFLLVINDEYSESKSILLHNEELTGSLTIEKVDSTGFLPIPEVLFGIYNHLHELVAEKYTDQNGKITIDHLSVGTYYVKELKALDDYEPLTKEFEVTIQEEMHKILTIPNRMKISVPKTGIKEFSIGFFISVAILIVGMILCHEEK